MQLTHVSVTRVTDFSWSAIQCALCICNSNRHSDLKRHIFQLEMNLHKICQLSIAGNSQTLYLCMSTLQFIYQCDLTSFIKCASSFPGCNNRILKKKKENKVEMSFKNSNPNEKFKLEFMEIYISLSVTKHERLQKSVLLNAFVC